MVTEPIAQTSTSQPATWQPAQVPFDEPITDWRHRHLLDVDTLSKDEILRILSTASAMAEVLNRSVARTPALRGVTIFQPLL